jgi:membrane protein required for beta-lactamase induction
MSYIALLIAICLETFLPDGFLTRVETWVNRFNQELEVNLDALGAPSYVYLQWWIPLLIWVFGIYFAHQILWVVSPLIAVLLSVTLLLYGIRFKHFAVVFTNVQLFLNQGDFLRARELFLLWMKKYDGIEYPIHRPKELIFQAIHHGTERALSQYFSLFFWFFLLPGPLGLVIYLITHWSVIRERDIENIQTFSHESLSMQQAWEKSKIRAALSPRFVLFALEWMPSRLLAFTVGLLSQLDDSALVWRTARNQSYFSNRAPLVAVVFTAVGLSGNSAVGPIAKSTADMDVSSEDNHVQALQQFRQLIFKCAVVWLLVTLMLVLLN